MFPSQRLLGWVPAFHFPPEIIFQKVFFLPSRLVEMSFLVDLNVYTITLQRNLIKIKSNKWKYQKSKAANMADNDGFEFTQDTWFQRQKHTTPFTTTAFPFPPFRKLEENFENHKTLTETNSANHYLPIVIFTQLSNHIDHIEIWSQRAKGKNLKTYADVSYTYFLQQKQPK